MPSPAAKQTLPRRKAAGAFSLALCIRLQVVGAAHTRKLFEKSLIKNFTS
jgi:hypothetical protein